MSEHHLAVNHITICGITDFALNFTPDQGSNIQGWPEIGVEIHNLLNVSSDFKMGTHVGLVALYISKNKNVRQVDI